MKIIDLFNRLFSQKTVQVGNYTTKGKNLVYKDGQIFVDGQNVTDELIEAFNKNQNK